MSVLLAPGRDDSTCAPVREPDSKKALPRVGDEAGGVVEEERDRPSPGDHDHELPPRTQLANHEILHHGEGVRQVEILSSGNARGPPRMAKFHRRADPMPV